MRVVLTAFVLSLGLCGSAVGEDAAAPRLTRLSIAASTGKAPLQAQLDAAFDEMRAIRRGLLDRAKNTALSERERFLALMRLSKIADADVLAWCLENIRLELRRGPQNFVLEEHRAQVHTARYVVEKTGWAAIPALRKHMTARVRSEADQHELVLTFAACLGWETWESVIALLEPMGPGGAFAANHAAMSTRLRRILRRK